MKSPINYKCLCKIDQSTIVLSLSNRNRVLINWLLLIGIVIFQVQIAPAQSNDWGIENNTLENSVAITKAKASFSKAPHLTYQPNVGQIVDTKGNLRPDIKYLVRGRGMTIYFRDTGISYVFERVKAQDPDGDTKKSRPDLLQASNATTEMHRVDIDFVGANSNAVQVVEREQPGHINYYFPHCSDGITDLSEYNKVTYQDIYHGIDWVLYLDHGQLRYDLQVESEADPTLIEMAITGSDDFEITQTGALEINTPMGTIREKAPAVYQAGQQIPAGYIIEDNRLNFELKEYNPALSLLIDPTREWATLYGGSSNDFGIGGCAANDNGDVFIYGYTHSTDFPVSTGAYQGGNEGGADAYLVKFDSSGNRLWATYYGGMDNDFGSGGCEVDGNGDIFIHGYTESADFPVSGAHQGTKGDGFDAFLVKFDSNGSRLWATYYGGSADETGLGGCGVDNNGNVFIHGYTASTDFPTSSAFQAGNAGGFDVYLVKFDNSGNLQWATYFGGANGDYGEGGCVADGSGNVFIHGQTLSTDFPVSIGAFQDTIADSTHRDAYLAKFDGSGNRLWATYYGGSDYEYGAGGCAVDGSGNVVLFGHTGSSTDFPVSSGAYQDTNAGGSDAYIVKFDGSGNRQWATFYGGTSDDYSNGGCDVDGSGNVFIQGHTFSTDFPVSGDAYQSGNGGGRDAYLVQFDGSGNRVYATYYGGSNGDAGHGGCAVDGNDNVYIHGYVTGSDFPVSAGAYQDSSGGAYDAYLVKFDVSSTLLPISINRFTGQYLAASKSVRLQWDAHMEPEVDQYIVERSADGISFESIQRLFAQDESPTYHFVDSELLPDSRVIYYRLRIVDLNSKNSYSRVISVNLREATDFNISYDPDYKQFRLMSDDQAIFSYCLYNLQGQAIQSGVSATNKNWTIRDLSAGLYMLQVQMEGSGFTKTYKVWIP